MRENATNDRLGSAAEVYREGSAETGYSQLCPKDSWFPEVVDDYHEVVVFNCTLDVDRGEPGLLQFGQDGSH